MKLSRVIHPFLFAIFPVLFLFSHNIAESVLAAQTVLFRLGLPSISALSITYAAGKLLNRGFKNKHKTGLLLSLMLLMFFSCGHFHQLVAAFAGSAILFTFWGIAVGPYKIYLVLWAGILTGIICILRKTRKDLVIWTRFLNMVSLTLITFSLITLTMYGRKQFNLFNHQPTSSLYSDNNDTTLSKPVGYWPDIYYLILDEYAAATTLKDAYGFDNQPFLDYLEKKGFYVASKAQSNYTFTALSLASSLNMRYINQIGHQIKIGDNFSLSDLIVPIRMVEENQVVRFLKAHGYRFVHFRSGVPPTEQNTYADWDIKCERRWLQDRFIKLFIETTMLEPFFRRLHGASKREVIECQLSGLTNLADVPRPFFIFAHVMIPHDPYVFGPDGEPVAEQTRTTEHIGELYINQVRFINKRLRTIIEDLLSNPAHPPIIILQGDHGIRHRPFKTHPDEWSNILTALYLPHGGKALLYDTITPVNIFRIIFNYYFGANYELLPDSTFFPYGSPYHYQFIEVNNHTDSD